MATLALERVEKNETALIVPADLTLDEGLALAASLGDTARAIPWHLGDLCLAAEDLWGELAPQVIAATRYAPGTLVMFAWVSRRVPPAVRRGCPLTWAHHQEVAHLESPEEQRRWLRDALQGDWTVKALREHIRGRPEPSASLVDASAALLRGILDHYASHTVLPRGVWRTLAAEAGLVESDGMPTPLGRRLLRRIDREAE